MKFLIKFDEKTGEELLNFCKNKEEIKELLIALSLDGLLIVED